MTSFTFGKLFHLLHEHLLVLDISILHKLDHMTRYLLFVFGLGVKEEDVE